jgi:hypothetical protein
VDPLLVIALIAIALGVVGTPLLLGWGRRVTRDPGAHPIGRYTWPAVKWPLAALGAYALVVMGIQSLRNREVGIGVAFLVFLTYEGVSRLPRVYHWIRTPH